MDTFKDIEVGQRFRRDCMFFEKEALRDGKNAFLVSDDKFEQERAKYIPSRGFKVFFENSAKVEPIEKPLLVDKFEKGFNEDWPAHKHAG